MDNSNTCQTCDEVVICLFSYVNANPPDNFVLIIVDACLQCAH